jgi:hypothetical protein
MFSGRFLYDDGCCTGSYQISTFLGLWSSEPLPYLCIIHSIPGLVEAGRRSMARYFHCGSFIACGRAMMRYPSHKFLIEERK